MDDLLESAVIAAAGLYLIALGISCFVRPDSTANFLLGHASSGVVHYLELAIRAIVGACLVHKAPALTHPPIFSLSGWVLIVTTAVLLLVPWRWHRQFTLRAVPHALRHIKLLGVSSIALGAVLAVSVVAASVA